MEPGLAVVHVLIAAICVSSFTLVTSVVAEKKGGIFGAIFATTPIPNTVYASIFAVSMTQEAYASACWSTGYGYCVQVSFFLTLRYLISHTTTADVTPTKKKLRLAGMLACAVCVYFVAVMGMMLLQRSLSLRTWILLAFPMYLFGSLIALNFSCLFPHLSRPAVKLPTKKVLLMRAVGGFTAAAVIVTISKVDSTLGGLFACFPTIGVLSVFSVWWYASLHSSSHGVVPEGVKRKSE